MFVHRLRRWPNIKTTLGQRLELAWRVDRARLLHSLFTEGIEWGVLHNQRVEGQGKRVCHVD